MQLRSVNEAPHRLSVHEGKVERVFVKQAKQLRQLLLVMANEIARRAVALLTPPQPHHHIVGVSHPHIHDLPHLTLVKEKEEAEEEEVAVVTVV